MKILIPILAVVAGSLVFFACRVGIGSKGGLSATIPDDFELDFQESGGMLPQGANYRIRKDSVTIKRWYQQSQNEWVFKVDSQKLTQLWEILRENQATQITSYEEKVFDRGGVSFSLTANGKTTKVSDDGMSFIEEKWKSQFRNIIQAINQFVSEGLKPFQTTFEVEISSEIPDSMAYFNISLGGNSLVSWSESEGKPFPDSNSKHTQISGTYQLNVDAQFGNVYESDGVVWQLKQGENSTIRVDWIGRKPVFSIPE